jgi:hypothetical protein
MVGPNDVAAKRSYDGQAGGPQRRPSMQPLHWTKIQIPVTPAAAAAGLYFIRHSTYSKEGVMSFAEFHVKQGQRT